MSAYSHKETETTARVAGTGMCNVVRAAAEMRRTAKRFFRIVRSDDLEIIGMRKLTSTEGWEFRVRITEYPDTGGAE